ncbi:pimeloyl-ACP methyl ester carboxylesterase [Sulfitobacter undariae]|uniref:Pimeloyl-ACP methyl ester carboxylesterase n=1 Tax=Sulfitobacter undariae TaxID=1563671 RepID=A0A7W6E960_9RHOB|nr:pimeloyl-ACP methyl ester carboxylesterase [Sulfitobacter undariae]
MIWLFLIIAIAAAAPFVIEHYRPIMSDGRRGSARGQFVELSQGVTHFHLSGPVDGPLVVCVHGLTTPSIAWSYLTKGLTGLGFRVLIYDLYGRGFSDHTTALQDKGFFNQQLDDLLEHLEIDTAFHLFGYSMGGAVAAGYAATNPTRVRRLVLLASAGFSRPDTPLVRFIRTRGLAGKWLMLAAYPLQLRQGIKAEQAQHKVPQDISDAQTAELVFQGFIPAVLSSLRGILARPLEGEHMALRQAGIPILALWGADDEVVPASAMGQLAAWNRDATHEVIDDAGHGLPYTHAEAVLQHITAFLPDPTSVAKDT